MSWRKDELRGFEMNEGQFTLEIWKNHLTKPLVKRLGCYQVVADDERL